MCLIVLPITGYIFFRPRNKSLKKSKTCREVFPASYFSMVSLLCHPNRIIKHEIRINRNIFLLLQNFFFLQPITRWSKLDMPLSAWILSLSRLVYIAWIIFQESFKLQIDTYHILKQIGKRYHYYNYKNVNATSTTEHNNYVITSPLLWLFQLTIF